MHKGRNEHRVKQYEHMRNEYERYTGTINMRGKTTENKSALDQEINKRKYIMYNVHTKVAKMSI